MEVPARAEAKRYCQKELILIIKSRKRIETRRAKNHETRLEKPDFVYYLAGADPYQEDQLGGLSLTLAGLEQRDRMVIEAARSRSIPIAITFAGGYARQVSDTVQIHVNTILAAREAFGR